MNFKELFTTALSALRGNLLRTLLTMLGIIIGIASVILIISLGDGATKSISNQLASFGTNTIFVIPGSSEQNSQGGAGQSQTLTLSDTEAITNKQNVQNIKYVSAGVQKVTQISANGQKESAAIQGVSADYALIESLDPIQGEFFTKDNDDGLSRVAVLGNQVSQDIFGEGAEPVGNIIKIDNHSFRVVGVLAEKDASVFSDPNKAVYIPVKTAMKILLGQNYVSSIIVQAENPDLVDQTVADIISFLADRHDIPEGEANDFTVRSSKQALATLGSVTGLLTALLAGIAGISLLVGGIGIMNIMLVTVTERTKEIGLLKAIGARKSDILTQFLIESVVLTLVGGAIGMSIGIFFSFVITSLAKIPFIISPFSILLAVGVSSGVGILFGIYPARQAAQLSPIEALRHE